MNLLGLGFWLRVALGAIFAIAVFLDFLNQNNLRSWRRSYLSLYLLAVAMIFSKIFPICGQQIITGLIFLSVIWLLAANWNRLGLNLFAIGGVLNFFVVVVNGGRMPLLEHEDSVIHQALIEKTVFPILSDWLSFDGDCWFSIGDILLFIGAVVFLIHQVFIFFKKRRP